MARAIADVIGQGTLLEREGYLATLSQELVQVVTTSRGRMVVLGGEAGVGKTALVRWFAREHRRSAHTLFGACDPLFTPRPLGPLLDVAQEIGGAFLDLVLAGRRPYDVTRALMQELRAGGPVILVIDDLQWADEATLDVVRLLARRLD